MGVQRALADAPAEKKAALRDDPRKYVASAWQHPNRPEDQYDFRTTDGETRLDYILHDDGPMNPESWGDINILLLARGMLKTTMLLGILNWAVQFHGPRGFEGYMTAPRNGQVKEFVGKFREKVEQSGLDQYREKDSIGHQKFAFENNGAPVYSSFKTDTGWGDGDALRGPHSHFGIADEFQDMNESAFNAGFKPVIDQELGGVPYFPSIWLLGTPKMEGSFYHKLWEKSDKRDWDPDAGEWVAQKEAEVYGTGEEARTIRGWHISQRAGPLHSEASLQEDRDLKNPMEFRNENLAEFYSPEDHLLAERHINAIADEDLRQVRRRRYDDSWVTIGIDWGGGDDRKAADTVMVVMEHLDDEGAEVESVIDRIEFLDNSLSQSKEMEELEKMIQRFDADRVIVDEGFGSTRRESLQDGDGTIQPDGYEQVVGVRFGNISGSEKVKWKDPDEQLLATAHKTHVGKRFVDFLKAQRLALPAADISTGSHGDEDADGTKLYQQLTAPYQEKSEGRSGTKRASIVSNSGDNDDAFDASVYAWMGHHIDKLGPTNSKVEFRTISGPGH